MRLILLAAVALSDACGREAALKARKPVRLSAGLSDTVVVHFSSPQLLPIRALDAAGQLVSDATIRVERVGGDSMPLTADGVLTCDRHGATNVRATLARLTASYVVLCRPVRYVEVAGPVQFVLGDSLLSQPRVLRFAVLDNDRHAVTPLAGSVTVADVEVAGVHGTTITPRSRGITIVSVTVGGRDGTRGVHVYQRVDSPSVLDTALRVHPNLRQFAVPLQLAAGEWRQFSLPPGQWMLTTQAATPDGPKPFALRVENALCRPNFLNDPGRYGCYHPRSVAEVYVYRPFVAGSVGSVAGYLLVRWLY